MDTISNRLPTGTPVRVTGEVLVQGSPINLAKEGPIGEYVRQVSHHPTATMNEHTTQPHRRSVTWLSTECVVVGGAAAGEAAGGPPCGARHSQQGVLRAR